MPTAGVGDDNPVILAKARIQEILVLDSSLRWNDGGEGNLGYFVSAIFLGQAA